jgi:hypothetical protein
VVSQLPTHRSLSAPGVRTVCLTTTRRRPARPPNRRSTESDADAEENIEEARAAEAREAIDEQDEERRRDAAETGNPDSEAHH